MQKKRLFRFYCDFVRFMFGLRRIIKKIVGIFIDYWRYVKEFLFICHVASNQKTALRKLKGKHTIRCIFIALFEEVWKCDYIYRLMVENPRFEPIILVCPIVNYGRENMVKRMDSCYEFFKQKGYNVMKAYDGEHYVDVVNELFPDILFYTNPYYGLIDDRYYITNFTNFLTLYVPYYFGEWNNYKVMCDLFFHNLLWRFYLETPTHKDYSRMYSRNNARNVVITGYPGIERLIRQDKTASLNVWKENTSKKKRIIWAPHHTIEKSDFCNYSCFLLYSIFMIEMAKKYSKEVQFVFKPHPLLRNKLEELWGKKETEEYYLCWEEMPNTSIKDGDYMDLFLSSDAMIHDSGSFLVEYLYVNKPVMRTLNEVPVEKEFNSFALKCLEHYYLARNEMEIEEFIQNVINNVDPLKEQRTRFVNEILMPKGSPSQNIVNDILESIDNQILYRN